MSTEAASKASWHYVPLPKFLIDDARAEVGGLLAALQPWINEVAYRLEASESAEEQMLRAVLTDEAEARAVLAQALIACPQWTGFAVAEALQARGWPKDQPLIDAIFKWSFGVKRRRVAANLATKAARRNRRVLRRC